MHSGPGFTSAAQAVKWAEELASRPDLRSQLGRIMSQGVASRGSPLDHDVALTISMRLAGCDPVYAGLAMKAIYGGRDRNRDQMLAGILAYMVGQRMPDLTPDQVQGLCLVTVRAEREMTVFGKRYSLRRQAREVGVSRGAYLRTVWTDARGLVLETLRTWLDQADREMTAWLDDRGWLYGCRQER